MKGFVKIIFLVFGLLLLCYVFGPVTKFEKVNNEVFHKTFDISEVDAYVKSSESKVKGIKPDNQSQFIWINESQKTEYAVVYLHGFSASHGEAQPIITNFARRYQCNTYLPRLHLHGLTDVDAFKDLTPKNLLESAKEAIAIGKSIGKKLIVVSTSTGSTLATFLAANDPEITALIMTAPNIDLHDQNSRLLVRPWGKQLFRKMMGSNYREWQTSEDARKYWTTKNRIEAHIAIRDLLNQTMTIKTFENINQPVYIGYYFKDEEHKDKIISIDAIKLFARSIYSSRDSVRMHAFKNASGHVISSKYMNSNWKDVENSIFKYCEQVLKMPVVPTFEKKYKKREVK